MYGGPVLHFTGYVVGFPPGQPLLLPLGDNVDEVFGGFFSRCKVDLPCFVYHSSEGSTPASFNFDKFAGSGVVHGDGLVSQGLDGDPFLPSKPGSCLRLPLSLHKRGRQRSCRFFLPCLVPLQVLGFPYNLVTSKFGRPRPFRFVPLEWLPKISSVDGCRSYRAAGEETT